MAVANVDLWLSVVPDPATYEVLAPLPRERVAALMDMLLHDVVLPGATNPDQIGSWENNPIDVDPETNEADTELVYDLVGKKLAAYTAARRTTRPNDDWSNQGVTLGLPAGASSAHKLGQYYYRDLNTRWCRYRLALERSDNHSPWLLTKTISTTAGDIELTAAVNVSLAVEMVWP